MKFFFKDLKFKEKNCFLSCFGLINYPQGNSNPRFFREKETSSASRRWGQTFFFYYKSFYLLTPRGYIIFDLFCEGTVGGNKNRGKFLFIFLHNLLLFSKKITYLLLTLAPLGLFPLLPELRSGNSVPVSHNYYIATVKPLRGPRPCHNYLRYQVDKAFIFSLWKI